MKPVDLFRSNVHTFWCTSFQIDLKLFDQFLLRRLGKEPLNAVVLCDEKELSESLSQLSEVDRHVAASANRRYLLRGMRLSSGGRFHPKTFLFASSQQTLLLVGSGNLTRSGLDRGAETFAVFDADDDLDRPVIRAWAAWIRDLVESHGDETLRKRYQHLREELPELTGTSEQSVFFVNAKRSLAETIDELKPETIEELHVSAPFFDEEAKALKGLIRRTKPVRGVRIYLGARPSVKGEALAAMLSEVETPVSVFRYTPDRFVHAKLIGIVGQEFSVLISGSANLSRAALDFTYEDGREGGNCEAIVARRGSAEEVTGLMCPPGMSMEEVGLDEIKEFEYRSEGESHAKYAIRILRGYLDDELRVVLEVEGEFKPSFSMRFDDHPDSMGAAPVGSQVLSEPIDEESMPVTAWIADVDGVAVSNVIALDDVRALELMLGTGGSSSDRPAEIAADDERSDLVALLAWAHRRFIFDIDDTPASRRARQSAEAEEVESSDFWERFQREELSYDERSQTYRSFSSGGAGASDLLLREIEVMLRLAPGSRRLRLVRAKADEKDESGSDSAGVPWTLSARQRVRSRNLIRRWARSLPDPRHSWLAPDAPAKNYEALIEVIALVWLGDALDVDSILELAEEIWVGLLGSESRKGLVDRAEPELWASVVESVSPDVRKLSAAIAYAALSTTGWKDFIYDWQPFLVRGHEAALFLADEFTSDFVEAVTGSRPTPSEIEELLLDRAEYVDDEMWGDRAAVELGLTRVRIVNSGSYKNVSLVVSVAGVADAVRDHRMIVLARRAMELKRSDHVLIETNDERLLLRLGAETRVRIDGRARTSIEPIDAPRLAAVEEQGGTVADLLGLAAADG